MRATEFINESGPADYFNTDHLGPKQRAMMIKELEASGLVSGKDFNFGPDRVGPGMAGFILMSKHGPEQTRILNKYGVEDVARDETPVYQEGRKEKLKKAGLRSLLNNPVKKYAQGKGGAHGSNKYSRKLKHKKDLTEAPIEKNYKIKVPFVDENGKLRKQPITLGPGDSIDFKPYSKPVKGKNDAGLDGTGIRSGQLGVKRGNIVQILPYDDAGFWYNIKDLYYNMSDEDYYFESALNEKAPPGMEDWIKSNKARFKKQYGKDKGEEILYATAWKRHNNKKKKKSESIGETTSAGSVAAVAQPMGSLISRMGNGPKTKKPKRKKKDA